MKAKEIPKKCPQCGGDIGWTGHGSFSPRGRVSEVIMESLYCMMGCGWECENMKYVGSQLPMYK